MWEDLGLTASRGSVSEGDAFAASPECKCHWADGSHFSAVGVQTLALSAAAVRLETHVGCPPPAVAGTCSQRPAPVCGAHSPQRVPCQLLRPTQPVPTADLLC